MRSTSGALRLFALSVAALWASEAALQGVAAADEDPIGTREHNITADAPSVNYRGPGWRSDTSEGFYQAYSNSSDASVTFSFTGVGAKYIATKKYDRGLCLLSVDNTDTYTVDLYDDSGNELQRQVIWTSPTLPYGSHNVTLFQAGQDQRFGFFPWLISQTWVELVPTDVAEYTQTQSTATATGTPSGDSSSSTPVGAIVGGTIGAVVAVVVAAFLLWLWRKDKRQNRNNRVEKVRPIDRESRKVMTIDDDDMWDQRGGTAAGWAQSPSSGGQHYPYAPVYASGAGQQSADYIGADSSPTYTQQPMQWQQQHHQQPQVYQQPPFGLSPTPPSSRSYSSSGTGGANYPYHVQGYGNERREYPIPEL